MGESGWAPVVGFGVSFFFLGAVIRGIAKGGGKRALSAAPVLYPSRQSRKPVIATIDAQPFRPRSLIPPVAGFGAP